MNGVRPAVSATVDRTLLVGARAGIDAGVQGTKEKLPVVPALPPVENKRAQPSLQDGMRRPDTGAVADDATVQPRGQSIAADQATAQALADLSVRILRDGDLLVGDTSLTFGDGRLRDVRASRVENRLRIDATNIDGVELAAEIDPRTSSAVILRDGVPGKRIGVRFDAESVLNQINSGTGLLAEGGDQTHYAPSSRLALADIYGPVSTSVDLSKPVTVTRTSLDIAKPATTYEDGSIILNDTISARYGERNGATDMPRYLDAVRNNEMTHALWSRMFDQAWTRSGRTEDNPMRQAELVRAFETGEWFRGMDVGVPGYDTSRLTTGQMNELASDAASIATYPRPEINRVLRSAALSQTSEGYNLTQRFVVESYVRARLAREPGLDVEALRIQGANARFDNRPIEVALELTDADYAFIQRDYMQLAQRGIQRYDQELQRRFRAP